MADWEVIDLTPFERAWDRTKIHMALLITKFMSNTLSTMTIYSNKDIHQLTSARAVLRPHKQYIIYINAPTR